MFEPEDPRYVVQSSQLHDLVREDVRRTRNFQVVQLVTQSRSRLRPAVQEPIEFPAEQSPSGEGGGGGGGDEGGESGGSTKSTTLPTFPSLTGASKLGRQLGSTYVESSA